ncbi:MAG: SRPBCC domain-containing protein [Ilumatobacteraceae bacterium]
MDVETIERQLYIEADRATVYEVVSRPEHVRRWWPDDALYNPVPGSTGAIVFGDRDAGGVVESFTVVDAEPPRMFSFRWKHPVGESATAHNSLLVTLTLAPSGSGTMLTLTETGFLELCPDRAAAQDLHDRHETGWDLFLPRLVSYASKPEVQR